LELILFSLYGSSGKLEDQNTKSQGAETVIRSGKPPVCRQANSTAHRYVLAKISSRTAGILAPICARFEVAWLAPSQLRPGILPNRLLAPY